ncbi:unnamed protein product [Polarella glacialis]|uniref:Uncharacterized protein n=1 Tax=Polarella glacialis TaxID=89957 RepID=A0A813JZG6_POLGL|nr:unnamed protein product [Polarella glacialis]CAE8689811.1 unnamed protein product [Polarella glacialis]
MYGFIASVLYLMFAGSELVFRASRSEEARSATRICLLIIINILLLYVPALVNYGTFSDLAKDLSDTQPTFETVMMATWSLAPKEVIFALLGLLPAIHFGSCRAASLAAVKKELSLKMFMSAFSLLLGLLVGLGWAALMTDNLVSEFDICPTRELSTCITSSIQLWGGFENYYMGQACLVVCGIFLLYVFLLYASSAFLLYASSAAPDSNIQISTPPQDHKATSVYQDFHSSGTRLLCTFAVQTLLVMYYTVALFKPLMFSDKAYIFWVSGVMMQCYVLTQDPLDEVGDEDLLAVILSKKSGLRPPRILVLLERSVLGTLRWLARPNLTKNDRQFWNAACTSSWWHFDVSTVGETGDVRHVQPSFVPVLIRMCMWYLANSFYAGIILLSAPLFLASCDTPMEFTLNYVAVLFIMELDDLKDPIKIKMSASDSGDKEDTSGNSEDKGDRKREDVEANAVEKPLLS